MSCHGPSRNTRAVLASRQGTALAAGKAPVDAFLSGYRWGLLLAAALAVAGGVTAFVALRSAHRTVAIADEQEALALAS